MDLGTKVLTGAAALVVAGGVYLATNGPEGAPSAPEGGQPAPAVVGKARMQLPFASPAVLAIESVKPASSVAKMEAVTQYARIGDGGWTPSDVAVLPLGASAKDSNVVVAAGLGEAVKDTNVAVVQGLSRVESIVMVDFVREMNRQYDVGDDVAFLADVDVWREGPLGEIITQALRAKRAGDVGAYSNLLVRYWTGYSVAVERRRVLGVSPTRRRITEKGVAR